MKKNLLLFGTFLFLWCITLSSIAQMDCGTDMMHQYRMQNDRAYAAQSTARQTSVYNTLVQNQGNANKLQAAPFVVPTVVHIIHIGEAVGSGSNLSDATVVAAIADLNTRMSNANGNGVNMNVQFCLASRDPNGLATNGITRYNGSGVANYVSTGITVPGSTCTGGADPAPIYTATAWPQDSYYNIYIFYKACGATAWSGVAGGYTNFQYVSFTPTLNGPLFAHETGHYLGLQHVFQGDNNGTSCPVNNNCLVDGDGVCDTPPLIQGECTTSTCPLPAGGILTNSTNNYLSYCFASWDRYTQGQKDRVTATLAAYPLNLLLNSLGCTPLTPNDAGILSIGTPALNGTYSTTCNGANYSLAPVVKLRNFGTATLTSASIKYKLDANSPSSYAWSGSLAAGASVDVTLPSISIPQGTHTFLSYTTLPNGAADGYGSNDSSDVTGIIVNGPTAITATTSQTNTTCVGNNGTATVTPSGGTLQTNYSNLTDFETPHTWTIVNGSQPNQWCAGAGAHYTGANGIYLSNNNCPTWSFTGAQFATVHFYKDFTFPTNASNIQIQFNWVNSSGQNCSFNVDSSDYINAYLVPTSTTPVAGTLLASGKIGGKYCNTSAWTLATITGLDANAGSSKRVVFTWSNDFCANTPPAIDNINVNYTQTYSYTYLWNNGQTTQTAAGLAVGTYTCTITDALGCTSTKSVTITNGCAVSISAGGPTTFCQGGSVVLTSSLTNGNLWSTGATTQSITVTTSGNYSCTNNGNTSNTITVTVPASPGNLTFFGSFHYCNGQNCTLVAPSASSYIWSTGATTQSIVISGPAPPATYTVTVISNGCPFVYSPSVGNYSPTTPTVSASGPLTFCTGGSVTLTANSTTPGGTISWLWSNGATTQAIVVTTSGNYAVTASNGTCTSDPSLVTTVTVQTCGSVTISAGGSTTFCSGGSVQLTSSLASGNVWSTGATTQSITATASGNYNCTNGGNTSNTIVVTVNPAPSATTSQTGTVSLCSGSLINGPTSGNAASFDGVDDYITITNNLSSATSFTFEAWLYWKGGNNWQRVFNFANSLGFAMYFTPQSPSGLPMFDLVISSSGQHIESTTALATNAWHHVAVTLSGTTGKIYIDGNLTGTNAAYTNTPATLGATIHNYFAKSEYPTDPYFNGYVDEVRFWNIARTQAQIQNNMNKTVSTSSSGLVSYYRLDESSGTSVLESVSNTSSGVANNGVSWLVPSTVPWNAVSYLWSNGITTQADSITVAGTYTLTVTGANGCTASSAPVVVSSIKPVTAVTITASGSTTICTGGAVSLNATFSGNALQFDGVNDYVIAATPMIPVSGSYSILFWAKESAAQGGFREIISQGRNFYIGRDNTGKIRLGDDWLNTGVSWPTDLQWHHYGVVRSGSNTYFYLDGNLAATKGSAIGSPIVVGGSPNNFVIGDQWSHGFGENFNGQVDDITIWSNQRSQAQIQVLMSSSPNLTASGLVAYYKFDEGTGTSTVDAVSNANPCIFTNGPVWVIASGIPYNIASYLWSTGNSSASIIASSKATYKVTATNNAGCTSTATKKVYVSTPKASITVTGSLNICIGDSVKLTASSGTGYTYQWTKNSVNINGATSQIYYANSAGVYKVIVTNTDGCTKLSGGKTVNLIVCSRIGDNIEQVNDNNLSVYPNPTMDFINVSFDSDDAVAELQIININGEVVIKKQVETTDGSYEELMDVSKFAQGMYMIQLRSQNSLSSVRFVKQ